MPLITVDPDLCNRDGICAAECPARIIAFDAHSGAVPEPAPGAETYCIDCGHCVAVCPTAALTHRRIAPADCLPVDPERLPDPQDTEHFLRYRRSIRSYKRTPVPRDTVERLLGMARFAPSAHNLQPVRWLVVDGAARVRGLTAHVVDWMRYVIAEHPEVAGPMHMAEVVTAWENGADRICRGAPALVIAHAPKGERTAPAACTLAMGYLELAAPGLGLGSCWAGYFGAAAAQWPALQAALPLPEGHVTYAAMMVGWPRYRYHRMPPRKPLDLAWM